MTKLIPAIFDKGHLIPTSPLNLPEHQKVFLAVTFTDDEIPNLCISKLAESSPSFRFLQAEKEDIYSPDDGEEIN